MGSEVKATSLRATRGKTACAQAQKVTIATRTDQAAALKETKMFRWYQSHLVTREIVLEPILKHITIKLKQEAGAANYCP